MSLEERLEKAEKLVAEVKAELAAMRVTKRNWPERIEAGMCFGREDVRYVLFGKRLASIESGVVWSTSGCPFGGDQSEFVYLGKIDLTIRTDAHEPTGAELVGRMCEFLNVRGDSVGLIAICTEYDPSGHGPYKYRAETGSCFCGARLAK